MLILLKWHMQMLCWSFWGKKKKEKWGSTAAQYLWLITLHATATVKHRSEEEIWFMGLENCWEGGLKNKDVTWQQVQWGHFLSNKVPFFLQKEQNVDSVFLGHLQPPSSQTASLSCVNHFLLHVPHMMTSLGVSWCGRPGKTRLGRFGAHCESKKTTSKRKVGGISGFT